MTRTRAAACGLFLLAACASQADRPTEHMAASMAAVRGAQTAGAEQVPRAALHLKLAQEQLASAEQLLANGDNERADALSIRAYNDAELALALTREAEAQHEFEGHSTAAPTPAPPTLPSTPAVQP